MSTTATTETHTDATSSPTPGWTARVERWLLARLQARLIRARVRLVLWDGTELGPDAPTDARVVVRDRRTLLGLLWDPELRFGEAYCDERVVVPGDLVRFLESCYRTWDDRGLRPAGRRGRRFGDLRGARDDIHRHYDLGNAFYRLWLDRQMLYTCAYFPTPEAGLEEAQVAKMDHVCRKLRLRPGDRVVEAGCGWGALALHMARRGATVRAFNISREQVAYARERARAEGLGARVEFVEDDFRAIRGPADVFVSLGMLEHVGLDNYGALGEVIDRCLDPRHGRGLLHFIGRNRPRPLNAWITRRIFPHAYPPTLAQVAERVLAPADLSVLDVENLRMHYARTLEHWLHRFEAAAAQVAAAFDERFVRAWRLYLAGSLCAFSTGALQLFQVSFGRSRDNAQPWTRAGLYGAADAW